MEDKRLELLTKMYAEFGSRFDKIDGRLDTMDGRLGAVENRLDTMDGRLDTMGGKLVVAESSVKSLKNDIIRLENKLDDTSKVFFDGYQQTYEKLLELDQKVDCLSEKVDKQEVEIRVIKGGKA